jgi:hypothetical protein
MIARGWGDKHVLPGPAFFTAYFFCLDWLQTVILPISTSRISGITEGHHFSGLSMISAEMYQLQCKDYLSPGVATPLCSQDFTSPRPVSTCTFLHD